MKSMNVNGTNPMVYFVKAIISFNVSLSDGRGIVSENQLGHAMGQEFRASLSVEDAGFAKSLASRMNVNGGSLNESK